MTGSPTVVWLRDDLRISDNPALHWAVQRGGPVVVAYVLDDESPEIRPIGSASRWWLHQSLMALAAELESLGGALTLRRGPAREVLPAVVAEAGASGVAWNRRYGPSRAIDQDLKERFRAEGLDAESFAGNVLFEPWTITNKDDKPFQVFTPFWKTCLAGNPPRDPLPVPTSLTTVAVESDSLADLDLLPTPDWSAGLQETWTPGEAGAQKRLRDFLDNGLAVYHRRDEPGIDATSMLSPHLRFGEVSPYQVWQQTMRTGGPELEKNRDKFLSEVGW